MPIAPVAYPNVQRKRLDPPSGRALQAAGEEGDAGRHQQGADRLCELSEAIPSPTPPETRLFQPRSESSLGDRSVVQV